MDYVHNIAQIGGFSSQSMPAVQIYYPEVSKSTLIIANQTFYIVSRLPSVCPDEWRENVQQRIGAG